MRIESVCRVVAAVVIGAVVYYARFMPATVRETDGGKVAIELSRARAFSVEICNQKLEIPATLGEFVEQWKKCEGTTDEGWHLDSCTYLPSGVDPWGQKFFYQHDKKANLIRIRSFGPDKKDDRGEGDDIQKELDLSTYGE